MTIATRIISFIRVEWLLKSFHTATLDYFIAYKGISQARISFPSQKLTGNANRLDALYRRGAKVPLKIGGQDYTFK